MSILIGFIFIAWLEASEPTNPACFSEHIKMLPEMCHAKFNREETWTQTQ